MIPINSLRRWAVFVVASLSAGTTGGCLRDFHLVGEVSPDAMGSVMDAGGDGAVASEARDTPRDTPDDGTDRPGFDGTVPSRDGGTDGSPFPDPADGATVVSLGDKAMLGWPIRLAPEEVARRLSQFVLHRPPSVALIAAVVASGPATNQDVGQLTDGLLLDETSWVGRDGFYRWWLDLDEFATKTIVPGLFPTFTSDARLALIDQTRAFVEDVTWRPQGDLATLLTEPTAFVSTATATWFPGVVVATGSQFTKVMLDSTRYAGIVTQPAVVTRIYPLGTPSPSGRGMQLLSRFLCQIIPEPPDASIDPGAGPDGPPTRQWLEANVDNQPGCKPCHGIIDPLGFAFGQFDAIGSFHDTDGGLPVDTTGTVAVNTVRLTFTGAPDLVNQLARLPEVRTCYAANWLAFATGKYEFRNDADTSSGGPFAADADYVVRRATILGRLSLRGTIRAVTETHTFLDP